MHPLDGEQDTSRSDLGLSSDDSAGLAGGQGRDQRGPVQPPPFDTADAAHEAVVTDHDALLQGGPLDGTSMPAGDTGLLELEVDGLIHRYTRTTQRGGPDGAMIVYAYDGAVDPRGADDGAEHAAQRAASPLAREMQGEDRG
jgi:hypothetical protein